MTPDGERALLTTIGWAGLPAPVAEYAFAKPRRWRFDMAWLPERLAVEVEGGTWSFGRHSRGAGYEADLEKYNEATLLGWRVIRVTTDMVDDGRALALVQRTADVEWTADRGFVDWRNQPRLTADRLAAALAAGGLVVYHGRAFAPLTNDEAATAIVDAYRLLARHGTRTGYEAGCRCQPCRDANNDYVLEHRTGRPAMTCSCGRPAYRPGDMGIRRSPRRCHGCHYTIARCICPTLPDDVARATSERPS